MTTITTPAHLDALPDDVLLLASGSYKYGGGTFTDCWVRPLPEHVTGVRGGERSWEVLLYGGDVGIVATTGIDLPATVLYRPDASPAPVVSQQATVEQARDEIAGWTIGSGYYQTTIGVDEAGEIAQALAAAGLLSPRTITPEQREAVMRAGSDAWTTAIHDNRVPHVWDHVTDAMLASLGIEVTR